MKICLLLILLSFIFACTKQDLSTPEGAVKSYIDARFSSASKDKLLDLTVGQLNEDISLLEGDELDKFQSLEGYDGKGFEVTHRNCSGSNCFITFILGFTKKDSKTVTSSSKVKKIANLEKLGNEWKVSGVTNVKTFHEMKGSIDIEGK